MVNKKEAAFERASFSGLSVEVWLMQRQAGMTQVYCIDFTLNDRNNRCLG
jgi:hypothetical protein